MDHLTQLKRKLQALLSQAGQSTIDVAKFTGQSTSDAFNTIDEAGLAMPLLASGTSAAGYPLHGSILSGDAVVHSVHPLEYFHGTALRLPRFHETAFAKEAKRKDYGTLYR